MGRVTTFRIEQEVVHSEDADDDQAMQDHAQTARKRLGWGGTAIRHRHHRNWAPWRMLDLQTEDRGR